MPDRDADNLRLVETAESVDGLNAEFYAKFPYPWPPMKIVALSDPGFEAAMLNQDLGDWSHRIVSDSPDIWIAGCGTNQAVLTSLRFPKGTVRGSDLSAPSLELCRTTARQLGVSNLELCQESLNGIDYDERFDYVLSTGVIHHNADPEAVLRRLVRAVKPDGIMELMVYNRHTWGIPAVFQKAVRMLSNAESDVDFDRELHLSKKLVEDFQVGNTVSEYLKRFRSCPEAMLADALLQPVLHGYTVESFARMAERCGLRMLSYRLSVFDRKDERLSWNMRFQDDELQRAYDALPDEERWQITNLLMSESSPEFLWFYFQRKDCSRTPRSEHEIVESFLDTVFSRPEVTQRSYLRSGEGQYRPSGQELPYPSGRAHPSTRAVVAAADGKRTARQIFDDLELPTDFHTANDVRLRTTTPLFPFLVARAASG